jgi:acetylglutamate kinase
LSLTDIAGVFYNHQDPTSLISCLDIAEAESLVQSGVIVGGMIPKIECCIEAIQRGVNQVVILDGRVPHALLIELLTDEGAGTLVVRDKADCALTAAAHLHHTLGG